MQWITHLFGRLWKPDRLVPIDAARVRAENDEIYDDWEFETRSEIENLEAYPLYDDNGNERQIFGPNGWPIERFHRHVDPNAQPYGGLMDLTKVDTFFLGQDEFLNHDDDAFADDDEEEFRPDNRPRGTPVRVFPQAGTRIYGHVQADVMPPCTQDYINRISSYITPDAADERDASTRAASAAPSTTSSNTRRTTRTRSSSTASSSSSSSSSDDAVNTPPPSSTPPRDERSPTPIARQQGRNAPRRNPSRAARSTRSRSLSPSHHPRARPIIPDCVQMYNLAMHQVRNSQREHDAQCGQGCASLAEKFVVSQTERKRLERIQEAVNAELPHERVSRKINSGEINRSLRIEVVYHLDMEQIDPEMLDDRCVNARQSQSFVINIWEIPN